MTDNEHIEECQRCSKLLHKTEGRAIAIITAIPRFTGAETPHNIRLDIIGKDKKWKLHLFCDECAEWYMDNLPMGKFMEAPDAP